MNHPLAGKNLHFDVEIIDIRAATDEELPTAMCMAAVAVVACVLQSTDGASLAAVPAYCSGVYLERLCALRARLWRGAVYHPVFITDSQ